jgi:hypothetical protein
MPLNPNHPQERSNTDTRVVDAEVPYEPSGVLGAKGLLRMLERGRVTAFQEGGASPYLRHIRNLKPV